MGSPKRVSHCTDEETEARDGRARPGTHASKHPMRGYSFGFRGWSFLSLPMVCLGPDRGGHKSKTTQ